MTLFAAEKTGNGTILRGVVSFLANLACTTVWSLARTAFGVNTNSAAGAAGGLPVGVVRHDGIEFWYQSAFIRLMW